MVLWVPCAIAIVVAAGVAINNLGLLANQMDLTK